MKSTKILLNLVLAAVLGFLVLNVWRPQQPASAENTCDSTRSVQVSGAAVINVVPDRALLQLGVQSNATTPDAAREANFQAIQKVISAVRALGVDAKDIATDTYIVVPVYQDYNDMVIKGYRVDNTVSITLRDINLADDVILTALKTGANEVQDVQFYTSELRKYRDQARDLAIQAASEKAQALASKAGTQAGCVLSISENSFSQYYGSWRGGRETGLWAQNVMQNAAPSQGAQPQTDDSPISLGQIAVRAEVSANYSLK